MVYKLVPRNMFIKGISACTIAAAGCSGLADDMLEFGSLEVIAGNGFTTSQADIDTVVEFSCNPGFELLGPVRKRCTSIGWTPDDDPTCESRSCTTRLTEFYKTCPRIRLLNYF